MREIKFKLWLPEIKKMTYALSIYDWANGYEEITVGDQATWLQYTGLKDRNGKEIYEGDIVRLVEPNRLYTVEFSDYGYKMVHAAPEMNRIEWGGIHRIHELGWNVEVIGNIYENPELLTKEKTLTRQQMQEREDQSEAREEYD